MRILIAIKNAFLSYKNSFDISLPCEKLFENFTRSLDNELKDYEIVFDYVCGKDTANVDGVTKGYYLKCGDPILMDISVKHEGVWHDVTRTFFVSKVSDSLREDYEAIKRSLKAGEKALKSGALASEVYHAVDGEFKKVGKTLIHHAGHVINEKVVAQPQFLPEKTEALNEGQVVAIESGLYGDYGIRLENNYLVTKDGNVNLFEDLMPLNIEDYIL